MILPRANPNDFVEEIPDLHPLSSSYLSYWREQKKRCIEGYWVGGIWMPPALYYYTNFGTIKKNKSKYVSTAKVYARPNLRDLEWDLFYLYTEARGFSGFTNDPTYSSHRGLLDPNLDDETISQHLPNLLTPQGTRKTYTPAREYLRKVHPHSLGAPLYENEKQNLLILGSRDLGKSFAVGVGMIGHQFLFDGATSYEESRTLLSPSEIVVGASVSDKSRDLLKKTKDSFDFLPGKKVIAGRTYPSPFSKQYSGSWTVNSDIKAEYKKKVDGRWETAGSRSVIKHRSFNENPFAAQGTRPDLLVIEECGMCFAAGTLVRMADLSLKPIELICVGDQIMGHDGTPRTVKTLHSGTSEMFEVQQTFGQTYVVNANHLLYVEQKSKVNTIKDDGIKTIKAKNFNVDTLGKYRLRTTYGIRNKALEFTGTRKSPIDPYFLGLWLGDGTKGSPEITVDPVKSFEILDYLTNLAPTLGLHVNVRDKQVRLLGTKGVINPITQVLRQGAVATDKHIPTDWQMWSKSERLQLLAGLIDSDGNINGKGTPRQNYEWTQTNNLEFVKGVQLLAQNLGFRVRLSVREKYTGFDKKPLPKRLVYRLRISGDSLHEIPCKVTYKKASVVQHKKNFNLTPIKVTPIGTGDYYGFELVENPLFLLEDGTIVHNSPELKDIYVHTVDTLRRGLTKTGTFIALGTGGDMEKGTLPVSEMFYEPEKYDFLSFEDTYEHRGKIAYFIPAYYSLDKYRDDNGYVDIPKATEELLTKRKKLAGVSGGSYELDKEMQYRPLVPSEMFLSKAANIFPFAELRRRLSEVLTSKEYEQSEHKVTLFFDPSSQYQGVSYAIDPKLQPITTFPYDGDNREGATVIFEFPKLIDGKVPPGAYIIGCDPFKDDSPDGPSLASIYVMKTPRYLSTIGYDEIVASYVGRPYMGKNAVNEILHKLALFYNAKIYFENSVGNVKDYFEKVRRLDLLATQPTTIFNKKASFLTSPQFIYGYPMPNQRVKWEALQYLRTWLLTERSDNKRNLDLIKDPALLQELISFNLDGNFDRVMGLTGCIIGLEEIYNLSKRSQEHEVKTSELRKEFESLIVNNKRLFNEKFSKTTTVVQRESKVLF